MAVAALGVAAAPGAVSGLRGLFGVDEVTELGPVPSESRLPFEGRQVPPKDVQRVAPFRVRLISSLGSPDAAFVRDDITGGMVTVVYGQRGSRSGAKPTSTRASRSFRPAGGARTSGRGRLPALWIEGTARGTFTLIGADGTVHRERFEVSPGVLLWKDDGMAFLLQGAGSKDAATSIAAQVDP